MPTQILMPALSPTMEEGKLAKWLVQEGSRIKPGDVIAEIETDKATMEVEAVDEGIVAQLLIEAGTEKVKVNTPIAVLRGEGEAANAAPAAKPAPAPQPQSRPQAATPAPAPSPSPAPAARPAPPAPAPAIAATNGHDVKAQRIFASPLARRLAGAAGIDLAALSGTGPHGRIIQRDIEKAKREGVKAPATKPTPGQLQPATGGAVAVQSPSAKTVAAMPDDRILALYEKGSYDVVQHDGMRRVIAERLTQSKQTVPHFYMSVDCRLDSLLAARERINAAAPKEGPRAYKLSVNDFVIKALALALQQVPAANATWTDAGMLRHRHSDVGVAVAVPGGLFTPIIKHAELKTLGEISNEMKDLAERARKRRLAPHEYQGGTTSISNLGMYGIKTFDAVINPPHATILAVGAGEKRPLVVGDKIEVATLMTCTLSCDHRVVDGAVGAELLNAFRAFIEDPVRMLV
ncbi:MAG TPA: pyruvate dehydrogenase complex dihydrolipoamide acetyltransferase [Hyphomicrobiaceae bacterium]|nr:pyruvate dehydrogenase complex dihydrolipoamide acetyltransferase [Hyphomicrobiaceae bacterium]